MYRMEIVLRIYVKFALSSFSTIETFLDPNIYQTAHFMDDISCLRVIQVSKGKLKTFVLLPGAK